MEFKTVLLLFGVFLTMWFGFVNIGKFFRDEYIPPSNIILISSGITLIVAYFVI